MPGGVHWPGTRVGLISVPVFLGLILTLVVACVGPGDVKKARQAIQTVKTYPVRSLLQQAPEVVGKNLRGLARVGRRTPYQFMTYAQGIEGQAGRWLKFEYDPKRSLAWWTEAPESAPGEVRPHAITSPGGWVADGDGVKKHSKRGVLTLPTPLPLGPVGALGEIDGLLLGVARRPLPPARRWVRIQVWDTFSRVPQGQYAYLLDRVGNEVQSVVAIGPRRLLVLEDRRVYRVDLVGATRLDRSQRASGPGMWETKSVTQLLRLGWRPARKVRVFEVPGESAVAGMSLVGGGSLALLRASDPPKLEWWNMGRQRLTGKWVLPAGRQSWTSSKNQPE